MISLICLLFVVGLLSPMTQALKKHNPDAKRVVVALAPDTDADAVAHAHGYVNLGELESLVGYHLFEESEDRKRQVSVAFEWGPKGGRYWTEANTNVLKRLCCFCANVEFCTRLATSASDVLERANEAAT